MSGLPDLSDGQREEVRQIVRETWDMASTRLKSGRSSMPIDIDAALVLVGLAAVVLDLTDPTTTPSSGTSPRESETSCSDTRSEP